MAGLDMNQEYLVLFTVDDEGKPTGIRVREDPQHGKIVRLFSSSEKLAEYLERSDENQRFMDMLERLPEHLGSEDLRIQYSTTTVQALSPLLEALDIDLLAVDPLPDGFYGTYLPPHKA
jgi:hypothetical protein